tara:strand:- start:5578 stop:6468 length:891 start_codon:yes stop_codon:yes gene_type:complete
MEMETMANPEIDENTVPEEAVEEAIFGSNDNQFFADLDQEVNGIIQDDDYVEDVSELPQVEESVTQAPVQGNPDSEQQYVDYEKRYKDSSREAQKMKARLDEIEPFMPILSRMNEDEGLVETVKDYLVNGKKPQNGLQLPEDFEFDVNDAFQNPEGDSGKYFNSLINSTVEQRVNNILGEEKQKNQQQALQQKQAKDAEAFKERMNIADDQFDEMMDWANKHEMTYDDIYYMKNRDKISNNVSNATRQDMLQQMQNVRNIPTSSSSVNSVQTKQDPNKKVLDAIKNLDSGTDNLFS